MKKFIRGYTLKQWNKSPELLPAEIITRLPVRADFNNDYFTDPYQGVPLNGYADLFSNILSNKNITVCLNTDFAHIRSQISTESCVIYTGMIDEYFDYCFGALEWRSLRFEWETHTVQDYQGNSVINYADENIPYTRIHEFKHYHPERTAVFNSPKTVICKEFSEEWNAGKEAYYPVNTAKNQSLLQEYQKKANNMPKLIFGGRLGCYRYWDMDKAIAGALECFENNFLKGDML